MAITSLALVADALKNVYLGALREQLNYQADPLLAQIERDTTRFENDNIVFALRYGKIGGIAALADDISDLPAANSRKTKQGKAGTKNLAARIMISDKTIEASKANTAAFANLLRQELEDAQTDAKDDLSRQVYGDGTGKLAGVATGATTVTLTVDSVQYLFEGMMIDIYDNANAPKATGREITGVDDANNTVTISGANVTVVTTDYIVRASSRGNEMTGLGKVFEQNTTLYTIDRNTNKWFNAQTKALNAEIDEVGFQLGINEVDRKTGGKINYIATSYGVERAWYNYQLSFKRNVNYQDLKGGWKSMTFQSPNGEIPIKGSKYAPTGKARMLDLTHWFIGELADWAFMDQDGAMLSRVPNKLAYEATLRKYADVVCDLPRGQYELTGITEH